MCVRVKIHFLTQGTPDASTHNHCVLKNGGQRKLSREISCSYYTFINGYTCFLMYGAGLSASDKNGRRLHGMERESK